MTNQTIISLHIPKAGGTSLLTQWWNIFSKKNVLTDYYDDPRNPASISSLVPNICYKKDNKIKTNHKVIHGHFSPYKYDQIENAFRLVFLREPLENVVSLYLYHKIRPPYSFSSKVYKDYCSDFDDFIRVPSVRFLYSRVYFFEYDMSKFDFIGDYASYDSDLMQLGEILELEFDLSVRENVTGEFPEAHANYKEERDSLLNMARSDPNYSILLKEDIEFYNTFKGL